jgi:hypothetical protein
MEHVVVRKAISRQKFFEWFANNEPCSVAKEGVTLIPARLHRRVHEIGGGSRLIGKDENRGRCVPVHLSHFESVGPAEHRRWPGQTIISWPYSRSQQVDTIGATQQGEHGMDTTPLAQRFYFRNGLLAKGMHFVESPAQSGSECAR